MKRSSIPLLLAQLLFVLAFAAPVGAEVAGREAGVEFLPGGKDPVFTAAFKENIESRVNRGVHTGVVVGVVTPLGMSFYSCGVKSLETKEPVDEHSVFEIGSNTKTFTALLLANAVVDGRLSLGTPLQELLPAGITAPTRNGRTIELVHLANHTSSLPRVPDNFIRIDPENPYAHYDEELLYADLDGLELPRDIGTKAVYSNYGMGLLGTVLAARNEATYEELVIRTITDPLRMDNTRMVLTPDMEAHLAKGHNLGVEVPNWDFQALAGAGAFRSTAVDMLKYLAANAGIEECELFPAMELSHAHSGSAFGEMTVGLGWITTSVEGEEIIWHDGGTGGYKSFMGFLKGGEMGVVVLTNSSSMPDDIGIHLLNPSATLETPKPSIAMMLNKIIESQGVDDAATAYADLKSDHTDDYDFGEPQLQRLGYRYLGRDRIEEAIAVFRLNVEAYPDSWNAYDSYGEALLENDETEKAIVNYRRSVELNADNHAGIAVLKRLGVEVR
jgi:D-alanyl-D-alanine-carboxypeptidase/D-alanyl-D-alanine-endopeptidase